MFYGSKLAVFNKHPIIVFSTYYNYKTSQEIFQQKSYLSNLIKENACKTHHNKSYKYFCSLCKVPLCSDYSHDKNHTIQIIFDSCNINTIKKIKNYFINH